jgi:hypothetical protein
MIRVEIKPELLSWARARAGYDTEALAHRFPKLMTRITAPLPTWAQCPPRYLLCSFDPPF